MNRKINVAIESLHAIKHLVDNSQMTAEEKIYNIQKIFELPMPPEDSRPVICKIEGAMVDTQVDVYHYVDGVYSKGRDGSEPLNPRLSVTEWRYLDEAFSDESTKSETLLELY
jgi:hypothetical protein